MPNTLVHLAIQAPASRLLFQRVEFLWIALGCIIPDIPWILQRILRLFPQIDRYDLCLYASCQASLLFCLILAAIFAAFARTPKIIFVALAANALFHLILDSLQIKLANGVHLAIPWRWDSFQPGLIWPEHNLMIILSLCGLIYTICQWNGSCRSIQLPDHPVRTAGVTVCILLYIFAPFFCMDRLEQADSRYIHTLRNTADRPGKDIQLDRVHFSAKEKEVIIFSGEKLKLQGDLPASGDKISLQGYFVSPNTIVIHSYHLHSNFRNPASYLGLFLIALLWLRNWYNIRVHSITHCK